MDYYQIIQKVENKAEHLLVKLNKYVLGQSHLYPKIINYIKRGETGLTSPKLPKGSFLSLGPTGVGKTETIKVIVEEFFEDPRALVRLNMSEYKTLEDMKQFLGNEHNKGFLQKKLESTGEFGRILLLDEIEKGHKEIQDILLQILDEGMITFHNGDTFSFVGWYIWGTSNIGAQMATQGNNPDFAMMEGAFHNALEAEMRPEIIERFNCILVYMRLQPQSQIEIAELLLTNEIKRLNELTSSDFQAKNMQPLITYSQKNGFTKALGARRLRKVVQEALQVAFYNALAKGMIQSHNLNSYPRKRKTH